MLRFNYYKRDIKGDIYFIVKDYDGDLEILLINEDEALKLCGVLNSMDKLCKYQDKVIDKYHNKISLMRNDYNNKISELDYFTRENKVLRKLLTN